MLRTNNTGAVDTRLLHTLSDNAKRFTLVLKTSNDNNRAKKMHVALTNMHDIGSGVPTTTPTVQYSSATSTYQAYPNYNISMTFRDNNGMTAETSTNALKRQFKTSDPTQHDAKVSTTDKTLQQPSGPNLTL